MIAARLLGFSMLSLIVLAALIPAVSYGQTEPTEGSDKYRIVGEIKRSDGRAAQSEIVYLFPYSNGQCSFRMKPVSDGRWYPNVPQAKTDSLGQFRLGFTIKDLEGATSFCVGMLVKDQGVGETVFFTASNGATWIQDLASFGRQRELNLAKTSLALVTDRRSAFDLRPPN